MVVSVSVAVAAADPGSRSRAEGRSSASACCSGDRRQLCKKYARCPLPTSVDGAGLPQWSRSGREFARL
eukprot:1060793-Lingulodinium_polyedra.AAC.1